MKIHSGPKVSVTCNKCDIMLSADRPSDIHHLICNGNSQYYVECPICGSKIEITEQEVPSLFKPYIQITGRGIMHCHE